jgi:hypothetical protein
MRLLEKLMSIQFTDVCFITSDVLLEFQEYIADCESRGKGAAQKEKRSENGARNGRSGMERRRMRKKRAKGQARVEPLR